MNEREGERERERDLSEKKQIVLHIYTNAHAYRYGGSNKDSSNYTSCGVLCPTGVVWAVQVKGVQLETKAVQVK